MSETIKSDKCVCHLQQIVKYWHFINQMSKKKKEGKKKYYAEFTVNHNKSILEKNKKQNMHESNKTKN